jgi:hypothetical protein
MLSCASKDAKFTPRSYLNLSLSAICATLPRLLATVSSIVKSPLSASEHDLNELEAEIRATETAVLGWKKDFDRLVAESCLEDEPSIEKDYKAQQGTAALGILAVACRLLGAISVDRTTPETRCITYMDEMKRHLNGAQPVSPWTTFYMEQKVVMPDAIINSTSTWTSSSEHKCRVIEAWRFKTWVDAMNRSSQYRANTTTST